MIVSVSHRTDIPVFYSKWLNIIEQMIEGLEDVRSHTMNKDTQAKLELIGKWFKQLWS